MSLAVCFYFQVHQPYRLRPYSVFDIGQSQDYFDHDKNRAILNKVADKCYLPTNRLMLKLLREHPEFKIAYSISGVALDQFEEYNPAVLQSFRDLVDTGRVEILSETYYHSLSFIFSKTEFKRQVAKHRERVQTLLGYKPTVFRNTELIYNNELAHTIEQMGYEGIVTEGADHVMDWRSPNFLYRPVNTSKIKLLLKNYKLSDDVAFRFSNQGWAEHPLSASKYANWLAASTGQTINLFMDYETFGEHQWADTGIFDFLDHLPREVRHHGHLEFKTPTQVVRDYEPVSDLDIHHLISWADMERDLSAWMGNKMQDSALAEIYRLEHQIHDRIEAIESGQIVATEEQLWLIENWRKLQTSDHFYYMCTKWFSDGDVHKYFNPYDSPYEAFITYMNVLNDIGVRIGADHQVIKTAG